MFVIIYTCLLISLSEAYEPYNVTESHLPYIVALEEKTFTTKRLCMGSLLSEKWVLTSATCLTPEVNRIRYGNLEDTKIGSTTYFSLILKKIPHPAYRKYYRKNHANYVYTVNDIAMLKVIPVNVDTFGAIGVVYFKSLIGFPVKCEAFGVATSSTMQFSDMWDTDKRMRGRDRPDEAMVIACEEKPYKPSPAICITPKCSNKWDHSLKGDEGGPLIHDGKIVGVCNSKVISYPGQRYTAVSTYLSWIKAVMQNE